MKKIFVIVVLILALALTSCNKENPVSPAANQSLSKISLSLPMTNAPKNIALITGILSRSGYDTLKSNFIITNDSASCQFNNVPVGTWHLQVNAYDSSNALQYSGSADINVLPGEITTVSLTLNPVTGSIYIVVTWESNPVNLIRNSSFEFNGTPSLEG